MKRDKKWWLRLNFYDRSKLVQLERADKHTYRSDYLPEGATECGFCGSPHNGYGLCPHCDKNLEELKDKANGTSIGTP